MEDDDDDIDLDDDDWEADLTNELDDLEDDEP